MRGTARLREAERGTTLAMREKDALKNRQREGQTERKRERERQKEIDKRERVRYTLSERK